MPQALFGRAPELAALRAAVGRLAEGESALLLISGPAGSGKSALIAAGLQHLQPAGKVHVAAASYEQAQQAAPFSALRQALAAVVRQILAADDATIARWQQRINASLAPNGQAMVDLIPELAWLVGPQPALVELEPEAHRQRFLFTLRHFIAALAPVEQPLILVGDNLHWADEDSLELFSAIANDTQPRALLLVGAVRSEALHRAPQTSPLARRLAALEEDGVDVEHLALAPLPLAAVNELVAGLLDTDPLDTLPLAERVQLHAQGNPFFIIELMQALVRAGAITRGAPGMAWRWDLAAVDRLDLSDDVAELLAAALDRLPVATQRQLTLGALLGSGFDLATLAQVQQTTVEAIAADLQPAVQAGLLAPVESRYSLSGDACSTSGEMPAPWPDLSPPAFPSFPTIPASAYRFRHDRIQEAALAGLADGERRRLHLRIGQALLPAATLAEETQRETAGNRSLEHLLDAGADGHALAFQAIYHLNAAADLITAPAERRQLAELNRQAGQQARAAAAYDAAWAHLRQGLALLPTTDVIWADDFDLALAMHVEGAEAAYLSGHHEAVEPLASQAAARAVAAADRVRAYQVWIQAAIAQNDLDRAMDLALVALAPQEVSLPQQHLTLRRGLAKMLRAPSDDLRSRASVLWRHARTRWALRGRRIEDLANLPPVTDPGLLAGGRIIANIGHSLQWQGNPYRVALLTLEGMRHSLCYGLFPTSAVGYAAYGAMLCMLDAVPGMGDVETAYHLGQLAMQLAGRPEAQPYRARITVPVQYVINHRCLPHRESLAPLLNGYQAGLESGDPEAAALCALCYVSHAYQLGLPLDEQERQISNFAVVIAQFRQRATELALAINHQAVLNLLGRAADPLRLTGERCDEEALAAELEQSNNSGTLTAFLILKAHLALQFHATDAALALADQVQPRLQEIAGFFAYPRFLALDALIRLAACDQASRDQRRRLLRQARADLRRLQPWARQAPMNHLHDVHLVQAELARVQGRPAEAAAHYTAAIQLCQEHGWANDEPLAAERAARFYLATGQAGLAQEHLRQARAGYLRWGALAVVQHFDQVYAAWLPPERTEATAVATTNEHQLAPPVDLGALLSAVQTTAAAEDLGALVQQLIAHVVTHSAAQRGVLLIPDPVEDPAGATVASLRVEAECLAGGPRRVLHAERLIDQPLEAAAAPRRVINFVVHSRQSLALADVTHEVPFDADPAVQAQPIRSLLCLPLRQAGRLLGVLYLENLPAPDMLPSEHVDMLALLATQAALAVQNARLWEERETREKRETKEWETGDGEQETPSRDGAGEVERWAAARLRQARLHGREGRWSEANAQVDEALALAQTAGDGAAWQAIALGFGAELAVLPGGMQRCQLIAQQAASRAPEGDDEWHPQGARLAQQAMIAWLLGRLDEVLEAQRQGLALAPPETVAWTTYLNDFGDLAISALTARRAYSQAQQALDMQAQRLRHAGSGPLRAARLLFRQARLDWLRGMTAGSSGLAQARQFFASQPDHPWATVLAPTLAGMAALAEDQPTLAEQHLRQASQGEASAPAARVLVQPNLLLAHTLHAQGAAEAALDVLAPVLEACRRAHTPGLIVQEGAAVIPVLRLAAQQGRCGPTAAHVLSLLGVSNVTRRVLVPETGIILSPREVDVLEMLAANASNRAIAERLDVDVATVKSHITRVLAKLGVRNRYEAAERAQALGLGKGW